MARFAAGLDMATGETRAQNKATAAALHRRLDANHDASVTSAEVRTAALAMLVPQGKALEPLAENRFKRWQSDRADINHDGRISFEEAIAGADQAFAEADTDHDAGLSPQEGGVYVARALTACRLKWRLESPSRVDSVQRAQQRVPALCQQGLWLNAANSCSALD